MDSLPSETLHRIFEHFESTIPFDNWEQGYIAEIECPPPKDLIALSRVCRRFRDVSRPLIYRTVAFQWREDNYEEKIIEAFMRTLCDDPHLGHIIRDFHVDHWRAWNLEATEIARKLLATPENLDERQQRWLRRWLAAERDWPNDDFLLILLILTPRLRMLDCGQTTADGGIGAYLSGRRDVEDHFFEKMLSKDSSSGKLLSEDEDVGDDDDDDDDDDGGESDSGSENEDRDGEAASIMPSQEPAQIHVVPPGHPFAQLREVRFRHDLGNGFDSASEIEGVLLHPGIETLRLFAFTWTKEDVKRMQWSNITSSLTSLQMKSSIVDAAGLKDILSRCRQLRNLHIVLAVIGRMDSDDQGDEIDFGKMGAVLRKYGQRLETFDFESRGFRGYFAPEGHLGSLKKLNALRQLKVSSEDLEDLPRGDEDALAASLRNVLPPRLENIHIRASEGRGYDGVPRALLTDKSFTALRTVEVEAFDSSNPEDLVVSGWRKSERVDLINRNETEEGELHPITIVIFSRDA